jgi:hypothetical protein
VKSLFVVFCFLLALMNTTQMFRALFAGEGVWFIFFLVLSYLMTDVTHKEFCKDYDRLVREGKLK